MRQWTEGLQVISDSAGNSELSPANFSPATHGGDSRGNSGMEVGRKCQRIVNSTVSGASGNNFTHSDSRTVYVVDSITILETLETREQHEF